MRRSDDSDEAGYSLRAKVGTVRRDEKVFVAPAGGEEHFQAVRLG